MDTDLFHTCLTCAMVESPLYYWISGTLQYARLLQLILVVQQLIHELLYLGGIFGLLQTYEIFVEKYVDFFHLYDSDFAVVFMYGLVEVLHHMLKLIRFLINFGCFRHV